MGFGSGSVITVEGGAINAAGRFGVAILQIQLLIRNQVE